jgi:hypothetical protein
MVIFWCVAVAMLTATIASDVLRWLLLFLLLPMLGVFYALPPIIFPILAGFTLYALRSRPLLEINAAHKTVWSWQQFIRNGVRLAIIKGAILIAIILMGYALILALVQIPIMGGFMALAGPTLIIPIASQLVYFLILGVLLSGMRMVVSVDRQKVNEGVILAIKKAFLVFVVCGGLLGVVALLLDALSDYDNTGDMFALPKLLLFANPFGTFGVFLPTLLALHYGGIDAIHHFTLRLVLAVRGDLPLNIKAVLDEGVRRGILRRVGGGYEFLHQVLVDHFARR